MRRYRPISLRKIKTYPLAGRRSKVRRGLLATRHKAGSSFSEFIDGLPDVLAASDLKSVADAVVGARVKGRPVVLGMGAHPIKVGLSPLIIDLIERGVITAMAVNGSCMVHDFELAFAGKTSEDVAEALHSGRFGMAKETGAYINNALKKGVKRGHGLGRSLGEFLASSDYRFKHLSIFAAAAAKGIPICVHVAMGTDIIHMHPQADGASIGEGSLRDFRLMCSVASDLRGGVYINLGSAVILPEVFLKALTVAKNLGHKVDNITTVNMDFIQHYRARENVLRRPTMRGGSSYALTGHHEIMFPLLAAAVIEGLEKE
jgi:deoxyhypusine synthase